MVVLLKYAFVGTHNVVSTDHVIIIIALYVQVAT